MPLFQSLKEKTWFKVIANKYVLILLGFGVWMLFFDGNSWLIHKELNDEIDKLEGNKEYFEEEISSDREQIERLKDSNELERFAREEYYMKKEGEEVFIIEYEDSIPQKNE
ncbi:FtsB family cell division protein [Croceiramulus getboli]|nr:septum formation initiator family protein [Flavobacteriaceae bacterium YJPT1-3]